MNEIKEKLLKGCGKQIFVENNHSRYCGEMFWGKERLCPTCQAKLQQHEETSKAKDEEFIKILDDLKEKMTIEEEKYEHTYTNRLLIFFEEKLEEIKQRIKEK